MTFVQHSNKEIPSDVV